MTPLRHRMLADMQIRNLSPHTQTTYARQVALFARQFGQSPAALGREEVRAYLVYLTTHKKLAPSSVLVATAAGTINQTARGFCSLFTSSASEEAPRAFSLTSSSTVCGDLSKTTH